MTLSEALMKAIEFDSTGWPTRYDIDRAYLCGMVNENARLREIIKKVLPVLEAAEAGFKEPFQGSARDALSINGLREAIATAREGLEK